MKLIVFSIGFGLFFIVLQLLFEFANCKCKEINATSPQFSNQRNTQRLNVDMDKRIYCCIFGVDSIKWWVKRVNQETFHEIVPDKETFTFESENRTLVGLKLHGERKGLKFKCAGTGALNQTLETEIAVILLKAQTDRIVEIINHTDVEKITFKENSEQTLYCTVKVYITSFWLFYWTRKIDGKSKSILKLDFLTTNQTKSCLIEGFSGWSSLVETGYLNGFYTYNFTLNLYKIKEEIEGEYACMIEQYKERSKDDIQTDHRTFHILVDDLKSPMIHISIVMALVLIWIITFLYVLKYDVEIFIKYCFRKILQLERRMDRYDFFFIYDFDNEYTFGAVFKVIKKLESKGYSSFFHHRDQTYGKNVQEDMINNLVKSDVIVFWVSHEMWKNPSCTFCMQMLMKTYPKKKRLYVLTEDKKYAMELCESKIVLMDTKSCMSSKTIMWKQNNIIEKRTTLLKMWYWHHILSRLISCLPINFHNSSLKNW